MQKILSRKLYKVIVIAVFCGVLIFINPFNLFSPVRKGFSLVFYPFEKMAYSFSLGASGVTEFLGSIGQLKKENEQLQENNLKLISENSRLHDFETENSELREQLGLLPRDKFSLEAANVISQDPSGSGNWIEIDKGSENGLVDGMAVIISKGILIGKVQSVGPKSSQVQLLTNPKSTINAITTQGNSKGVIKGEYGLGIILDMVLQSDSLNVGDEVITSGVGGSVPRGLFVGNVQEIHPSDDHLFQQASVSSPVQLSKLQFVFVIKKN